MRNIAKTLLRLLPLCLFIFLFACSKVTQVNFQKVKPNMTMKEVVAILGEPSSSESINIAGISGTSAVWKDKTGEIDIQFLNDRVTVTTFSKPRVDEASDQQSGNPVSPSEQQ